MARLSGTIGLIARSRTAPPAQGQTERTPTVDGFDPKNSFGYEVSKRYDTHTRGDETETVAFLARLAGGGGALEFAVGTGRIALPLAKAGVRVDGIELSQAMVDRMRGKAGGNAVEVTIGDMSRVTTGRRYGLVYLIYNTIGTCSPKMTRSLAFTTPRAT
jgi:SAM-dependent methyltransferase